MKKILHFDDEQMLGNMMKARFEKEGFVVQYYEKFPEDKEELINLVLAENPDIILTDIIHPGIDGFQMTEILKSDERTKNIPICAFTNLGEKRDIEKGMNLGMSDYMVSANTEPSEVIRRLKVVISKEV